MYSESSSLTNGQYANLMTSIHATPKVSLTRYIFPSASDNLHQLPPPEFRNTPSSSSKITPSQQLAPSASHARPPNSTSSTPSCSTNTTTTSSKPAPLQAHASQEQSPSLDQLPTFEKPLKPVTTTKIPPTTAGKAVPTKAKRGLKRL